MPILRNGHVALLDLSSVVQSIFSAHCCPLEGKIESKTDLFKPPSRCNFSDSHIQINKYVTLSAKTSLMLEEHKAGFHREGHNSKLVELDMGIVS